MLFLPISGLARFVHTVSMTRDQLTSFPCSFSFASLVVIKDPGCGWVVKNLLDGRGGRVLIVAVTNFVGFKSSCSS